MAVISFFIFLASFSPLLFMTALAQNQEKQNFGQCELTKLSFTSCRYYLKLGGYPYPHGTGCLNPTVLLDYPAYANCFFYEDADRTADCFLQQLIQEGKCKAGWQDPVLKVAQGQSKSCQVSFAQMNKMCSIELKTPMLSTGHDACVLSQLSEKCESESGARPQVNCMIEEQDCL